MEESLIILIIVSGALGVASWLLFLWAVKRGEFEDSERPKYRMLDDEADPEKEVP